MTTSFSKSVNKQQKHKNFRQILRQCLLLKTRENLIWSPNWKHTTCLSTSIGIDDGNKRNSSLWPVKWISGKRHDNYIFVKSSLFPCEDRGELEWNQKTGSHDIGRKDLEFLVLWHIRAFALLLAISILFLTCFCEICDRDLSNEILLHRPKIKCPKKRSLTYLAYFSQSELSLCLRRQQMVHSIYKNAISFLSKRPKWH